MKQDAVTMEKDHMKRMSMTHLAVSTKYRCVTDIKVDRETDISYQRRVCYAYECVALVDGLECEQSSWICQ